MWAEATLEPGEARVLYDDARQAPSSLTAAVDMLGFQATVAGVAPGPGPTLHVEGLTDAAMARRVKRTLRAVPGVRAVGVSREDGAVFVSHDPGVTPRVLAAALQAAGFKARVAAP
jgi:copper chaperone CopZ